MSDSTKTLLGTILFAIYGPFLIYIYVSPQEIIALDIGLPFRKIFMLDRDLVPTFFTLGMGVLFTIIAFVGAYKFVSTSNNG